AALLASRSRVEAAAWTLAAGEMVGSRRGARALAAGEVVGSRRGARALAAGEAGVGSRPGLGERGTGGGAPSRCGRPRVGPRAGSRRGPRPRAPDAAATALRAGGRDRTARPGA